MFAKAISEVKTALTSKGKGDSFLGAKVRNSSPQPNADNNCDKLLSDSLFMHAPDVVRRTQRILGRVS